MVNAKSDERLNHNKACQRRLTQPSVRAKHCYLMSLLTYALSILRLHCTFNVNKIVQQLFYYINSVKLSIRRVAKGYIVILRPISIISDEYE